jgi:hypothetical protein
MANDPNSTKSDPCAQPRSPDHTRTEPTSGTPRSTPTEPTWWPDDSYGLIFLPRFVEKIGFRVFADWTGAEASTEQQVVLLPELAAANPYHRIYADDLLRKHRPDLTPWPYLDFASGSGNHKHWPIAQQLAKDECNEAAPALLRLRSVRDEIRRQSCAGELPLKIRRVSGGPFEAFQPMWWNRDNPNELFDCCIIDPEYPFGGRPSWKPNLDSWIFAPHEGIDQIVARLTAPPEAESQLSRSAIEVDSTELDPAAAHAQSAPAQETPARQELVWPSAEQLGIVKAPKQTAILRKWPELCRRYPNTYNADKVRAGEVSARRLADDVGGVGHDSAGDFLAALRRWLEQRR